MILEAARRVFLTAGFAATSVDAIAADAGVSKQTIYNHFGDKRRLFAAVIAAVQDDATAALQAGFSGELPDSGDIEADLRQVGRVLAESVLLDDVVAMRRIVISERSNHPDLIGEWGRPRSEFEAAFAARVQQWVDKGLLDIEDTPLAMRQFLVLTTQEALFQSEYALRRVAPAVVERIVDDGVRMWLRCYRSRL
ncbi:MAG TPA: TetR/AcrR family transcriptional regulator [Propionicimonas sp.]|uniref:TetR/AcrR family transcriptional regulator n=1 Tax=Propionicimonas sp. TaxID=1955623 RepID=UPI002F406B1C